MERLAIVNEENISGLIQRTLNWIDSRLIDHGTRVAWIVSKMLEVQGGYTKKQKQDVCVLALLHDVGAYKTEEIDKMLQFETSNIWGHSIYGYLFLHHLSPFKQLSQIVLYHHTSAETLNRLDIPFKDLAQIMNIADRVDVYVDHNGFEGLKEHMEKGKDRFFPHIVDLFYDTFENHFDLHKGLTQPIRFRDVIPTISFTEQELEMFLKMLVYSIDFRSQYTVTHSLTTICISDALARFLQLSPQECTHVHYGAMLHDLGKIGIPVEILEFPGKLSAQAMTIMRTHVDLTEEILGGTVDPITTNIALRHHEKLDGSGYPRGLTAEDLSIPERIVAVADISSALLGRRSYKESFSKDHTISILLKDAENGLLDKDVVHALDVHFSEIMEMREKEYEPMLQLYRNMNHEYEEMLTKYTQMEQGVLV